MMPVEFLSFLVNKDGASYYLDNNVVNTTTTPTPTKHLADGWADTKLLWERNLRYMASIRQLTTPYKFIKDAAKIIRTRFYPNGPEDRIYLVSKWLDKSFGGGWIHRTLFKGELDLSQYKNSLTDVTMPIAEGDLYKLFKANETTIYPIPISGPILQDDGILLFETGKFIITDGIPLQFGTNPRGLSHPIPMVLSTTEGRSSGITFVNQDSADPVNDQYFAQNTTPDDAPSTISIRLVGSIPLRCTRGGGASFVVQFKNDIGGAFVQQVIYTGVITNGAVITIPFDITVPLAFSKNMQLVVSQTAFPGSGDQNTDIVFDTGGFMNASFSSRYKITYTPVMRPMDVAQALLDNITGGGYTVTSNYFSTVWENLCITSGDAIRGIVNPVIKTCWADFFDSYNVPCNIAMDIQAKTISIEPKATAFISTVVMDLGEVKDMEDGPDGDFQYNQLAIGYPNLDSSTYESLNAKEEFNVTSNFTTIITRYNKKLELISKYHASMYEQELARINLDGKDTTAASVDETVFFKLIEKTETTGGGGPGSPAVYYKYLRSGYDSISGLLDAASAYNVPLSPKQCLLRMGNYLRSIFYWQSSSQLTFTVSDQTPTLKVVKAGVTIDETANVQIGSLDSPLFIPHVFNTNSNMNRLLVNVMKNTPYGTFSFTWLGNTYFGFAKSISIQPANRPAQDSVFICSPQTDLTTLIR